MELKPAPEFLRYAARTPLVKGQWMPCPKCGYDQTVYSTSGQGLVVTIVVTALLLVVGIFIPPVLIGALVFGAVGLILTGVMATATKNYGCKRCFFHWSFDEAEEWARQDLPAEPASKP